MHPHTHTHARMHARTHTHTHIQILTCISVSEVAKILAMSLIVSEAPSHYIQSTTDVQTILAQFYKEKLQQIMQHIDKLLNVG